MNFGKKLSFSGCGSPCSIIPWIKEDIIYGAILRAMSKTSLSSSAVYLAKKEKKIELISCYHTFIAPLEKQAR